MILFLFGSGISGAPKIGCLTEKVLRPQLHEAARYGLDGAGLWSPEYEKLIPAFLNLLNERCKCWYGRPANYEDFAAICSDLDHEYPSGRNATLEPFMRELCAHFDGFGNRNLAPKEDLLFNARCRACRLSIRFVVSQELRSSPGWNEYAFRFLKAMPLDGDDWAVATLNHDLILEEAFARLDRPVERGFHPSALVDEFGPMALRNPTHPLLLKLHGSIDWHRSNGKLLQLPATHPNFEKLRNPQGPEILVGTVNKLEDYNYASFPFLFGAFDRVFEKASHIVVAGYGFNDPGINARLFGELRHRPELKAFVIDLDMTGVCTKLSGRSPEDQRIISCRITQKQCAFKDASQSPIIEEVQLFLKS
jgi:SIR2-like domain